MIVSYFVYDPSGAILRKGHAVQGSAPAQAFPGSTEVAAEGECDQDTQYYDIANATLRNKENSPAAIDRLTIAAGGVEVATISNIPDPTRVSVYSASAVTEVIVTGGTLAISLPEIGVYKIKLVTATTFDKEFVINAA